jgi:hypothetical protein
MGAAHRLDGRSGLARGLVQSVEAGIGISPALEARAGVWLSARNRPMPGAAGSEGSPGIARPRQLAGWRTGQAQVDALADL